MSSRKTEFIVIDLISKIYQQKFWNNKLPTQRDLASAYQVSRFTIQKALKRLESIGLISVIQGDGIYVRA
ncbi:MAG: GntR family transcriptional regulator, partial [Lacrimispora sp.]|nr:GntR family transcriptional regulator [Lacrimispora sp.]